MFVKFVVSLLEGLGTGFVTTKEAVIKRVMSEESISTKEKAFLVDWLKPCVDDVPGIQNSLYSLFLGDTVQEVNKGVAFFSKVEYSNFSSEIVKAEITSSHTILDMYENLKIPKRATKGSAGYDFYTPFEFELKPGETIKIPTGIRCGMNSDYVLQVYPRSGLGFKYRCQLDNTVGIIDSDYYNSDNEGHIMIKITNDSKSEKVLKLDKGDAFCQGIFLQYGKVIDDDCSDVRNGGFGSTSGK